MDFLSRYLILGNPYGDVGMPAVDVPDNSKITNPIILAT
jgi:hypothetical protein